MTKKKEKVLYHVSVSLKKNDVYVKASSIGEARKKAYDRLAKRKFSTLVDRQNTSVEKW